MTTNDTYVREELWRKLCSQQPLRGDSVRQRDFCAAVRRNVVDFEFLRKVADGDASLSQLVADLQI